MNHRFAQRHQFMGHFTGSWELLRVALERTCIIQKCSVPGTMSKPISRTLGIHRKQVAIQTR
jgi:hypothetical protein